MYSVALMMDGGLVKVEEDGTIEVSMSRNLTADELAVFACISQLVSRLKGGKLVKYDFDAKSFDSMNSLMKCEWLRSGKLKVHGETNKNYRFVDNMEAAILEHRTFTCRRSLIALLPPARAIVNSEDMEGGKDGE